MSFMPILDMFFEAMSNVLAHQIDQQKAIAT